MTTIAPGPIVSVIVPHLNQQDYLRRCLISLYQQTLTRARFEIIVVDNGSRKSPDEILNAYPDVRFEQETTAGPGPARNRGVRAARGSILAFIDADCTADPNWLGVIVSAMDSNACTHIIGGDVRIDYANPKILTMLESYESIFAYRQREYIERQGFSGTGNLALRKEAYDAVGPFAGIEVAEDRDWGQRAGRLGYKITYVPQMIVFHPARQSFHELFMKWNRHIRHDFIEKGRGVRGKLRWLALALAVCASPVLEVPRILTSDRVPTWRERFLAFAALVRIRIYRGWRMVTVAARSGVQTSSRWNQ